MSVSTRTVKTVLISVPSAGRYSRWVYRTVECGMDQHGYRNERGVRVLFESGPLYRPAAGPRSKGYAAKRRAEDARRERLAAVLSVPPSEVP